MRLVTVQSTTHSEILTTRDVPFVAADVFGLVVAVDPPFSVVLID
jgi:hypothetical protein